MEGAARLRPLATAANIQGLLNTMLTTAAGPSGSLTTTAADRSRQPLLRRSFLPGKPLLKWAGNVTLSPAAPEAVLWAPASAD